MSAWYTWGIAALPSARYARDMDTARERYVELDGYRGLAAFAVVAFHASGFVGYRADRGQAFYAGTPLALIIQQFGAGVVWFFVLSGFVIFLPFARATIEQTGPIASGPFLARRAIRILPL